jgi:hypothetical protein
MIPIHAPVMPGFGIHATRVADFIDHGDRLDESGCVCCGMVGDRLASYPVPPLGTVLQPAVHDFSELVRICSHCRKEKFVTLDHPF